MPDFAGQGKINLKNAASLLVREYVNRRGLDLTKEVLWVSVCQRVAKLQAVILEIVKKFCHLAGVKPHAGGPCLSPGGWNHSKSLTEHNFAAL